MHCISVSKPFIASSLCKFKTTYQAKGKTAITLWGFKSDCPRSLTSTKCPINNTANGDDGDEETASVWSEPLSQTGVSSQPSVIRVPANVEHCANVVSMLDAGLTLKQHWLSVACIMVHLRSIPVLGNTIWWNKRRLRSQETPQNDWFHVTLIQRLSNIGPLCSILDQHLSDVPCLSDWQLSSCGGDGGY